MDSEIINKSRKCLKVYVKIITIEEKWDKS